MVISFTKQIIGKENDTAISLKYKKDHSVTPEQVVVNVLDLGYLV